MIKTTPFVNYYDQVPIDSVKNFYLSSISEEQKLGRLKTVNEYFNKYSNEEFSKMNESESSILHAWLTFFENYYKKEIKIIKELRFLYENSKKIAAKHVKDNVIKTNIYEKIDLIEISPKIIRDWYDDNEDSLKKIDFLERQGF